MERMWDVDREVWVDPDGTVLPDQDHPEIPRQKHVLTQSENRKGGLRGGRARAAGLSPEKRREIAQKGGKARHHKSA
jgi:Stress-induced bacterial acidophilic repeat motif